MIKRIGFACKWIDTPDQVDGIRATDDCKQYNTGATTITWLNKQTKEVAEQKLWDLMVQNLEATRSSDILPAYTQSDWSYFWSKPDVVQYLERNFILIGDSARASNTRVSMHPGQFTVLASDNPDIVRRSIEEFEYHADMVRYMGYGKQFQDFKINVHISGRAGPEGIRAAYKKLTPEARNCITIENEEMSHGLSTCLSLGDLLPIVLDIHHHWIKEGEYIMPNDPKVQQVLDSWRGLRPTMHYSVSREDVLVGHCTLTKPDHKTLLESGHKKQKLRAHSNFYWNKEVNDWALTFNDQFDIMCESKAKNLASKALFDYSNT